LLERACGYDLPSGREHHVFDVVTDEIDALIVDDRQRLCRHGACTGQQHTYLAINQDVVFDQFLDTGDLLLDITGATGTIAASNFIT
jgi:hypothetical protein